MSKEENLLNFGNYLVFLFFLFFFLRQVIVAMVIVINTMIGGFGRKDLVRLAASTVRLQVSN